MNDISLHILDIAENSIIADAKKLEIIVNEDLEDDKLTVEINDDGKGIAEDKIEKLTDPFFTTRTTRKVGMGIPMLKEAAEFADGNLEIKSIPGCGTNVKAVFKYSHIDRKPLGDMPETLISLILRSEDTEIFYRHLKNKNVFEFNTEELKESLNVKTLKEPVILNKLKIIIQNKLSEL